MAGTGKNRRMRILRLSVAFFSLVCSLMLIEVFFRYLDGFSLGSLRLVPVHEPVPERERPLQDRVVEHVRNLPVAKGVDRTWFTRSPAPLPERSSREEFPVMYERVRQQSGIMPADAFKLWNDNFVRASVCSDKPSIFTELRRALGFVYAYRAADPGPHPPYRYFSDMVTPAGLSTNRFGWRGPDLDVLKPPSTIRLAFLGASTTVSAHAFAFSYPEYVGNWLNIWAESKGLNLRFEILNTGREGIRSTDIAAIVEQELAIAAPDIAIYYEGSNQFQFRDLLQGAEIGPPTDYQAVQRTNGYSALARRLLAALDLLSPQAGQELPKPPYFLKWPEDVDEDDPDLNSPHLPVNLSVILADLEDIRSNLNRQGAELAVSSFFWMVEDGMVLDLQHHRTLFDYLNKVFWPYRYRDLRRLADFQNRVLAKYAASHDLPFLDVASLVPHDPFLFRDAIHMHEQGLRLRAWITFQLLVPILEARIKSGALPRRDDRPPGLSPAPLDIYRHDLRCPGQRE